MGVNKVFKEEDWLVDSKSWPVFFALDASVVTKLAVFKRFLNLLRIEYKNCANWVLQLNEDGKLKNNIS